MTNANLEQLLTRVADADREAFAALYDLTAAMSYGLALRVLKAPRLAEEAVQEVYLQVWTQAARFDPARGSARAWIATIAHRRAVDTVRRVQSARNRELAAVPDADAPDIADIVVRSDQGRRVRAALGGLTDLQRQVIELAYFGGMTQSEVAGRLGVPLGTVKTRMRDGMIRLRSTLRDRDD